MDYGKILGLPLVYIFTQLTSLVNTFIDFTSLERPLSSSSCNKALQFGIAMDIIFPEVVSDLITTHAHKESMTFTLLLSLTQVGTHSFMEADGLTHEDAFNYYCNLNVTFNNFVAYSSTIYIVLNENEKDLLA